MPNVVASTATGTVGTATATAHTITTPACTQGDLLVASLTLNGGTGTVTEASGWTRIYPAAITDDGFMTLLVYTRTATATDAAGGVTHTWTTATAVRSDRGCVAIRGQAQTPVDSSASEIAVDTNVQTQIITTTDNTLILSFVAIDSATENATPTAPLVELWDPAGSGTNTGQVNAAAWAQQPTAGPVSYAWTWTNNLQHKHYLVAIAGINATLAVTAGITATGSAGSTRGAALAATAAIGAAGSLGARTGALAVAATATLTATGQPSKVAGTALTVGATITAAAQTGAPMAPALYSIDGGGASYLVTEGAATATGGN